MRGCSDRRWGHRPWSGIAATLLALPGLAASPPDFAPRMDLLQACTEAPAWTPTGQAICAREGTEAADRRIDALLREASDPRLALNRRDLDAAQQAFRRYRDLHCRLYDRGEGWRGSQTPADVETCRFERTLRREAELRALIWESGPR